MENPAIQHCLLRPSRRPHVPTRPNLVEENVMRHASKHTDARAKHRRENANIPAEDGATPRKESQTKPPSDTEQSVRDKSEKRRHAPSENALKSVQDKNPIPPGSIRE